MRELFSDPFQLLNICYIDGGNHISIDFIDIYGINMSTSQPPLQFPHNDVPNGKSGTEYSRMDQVKFVEDSL